MTTTILTSDLAPGMRVRAFAASDFAVVRRILPEGRAGARVEFDNDTSATVGRGDPWELDYSAQAIAVPLDLPTKSCDHTMRDLAGARMVCAEPVAWRHTVSAGFDLPLTTLYCQFHTHLHPVSSREAAPLG